MTTRPVVVTAPTRRVGYAPPGSLTGLVGMMVQSHAQVTAARERTSIMTTLAATLVAGGRAASVSAREPDGTEWTIRVGSAEAGQP